MSRATVLISLMLLGGCVFDEHVCEEENLLTIALPANVSEFRLFDSSRNAIWEIRASPPIPLDEIRYGAVPPGAIQTFPAVGSPRALVPGEQLLTETLTDSRYLLHHGLATGPAGFCGGVYESGPLSSWDVEDRWPKEQDER